MISPHGSAAATHVRRTRATVSHAARSATQVDATVAETIGSDGWVDVLPLLPPSFGAADAAKLIDQCASVASAAKTAQAAQVVADS